VVARTLKNLVGGARNRRTADRSFALLSKDFIGDEIAKALNSVLVIPEFV
jgi:hypothetical protein